MTVCAAAWWEHAELSLPEPETFETKAMTVSGHVKVNRYAT